MQTEISQANHDQLHPQSSKRQLKLHQIVSKLKKTKIPLRNSQVLALSKNNQKKISKIDPNKLTITQKQKGDQNPQYEGQQNSVYKNVRTIRKVATFLQNAKTRIVLQKQHLQPQQLQYLQSDRFQQSHKQILLRWDNPVIKIFQIIFLVLMTFGIWLNTYQLVLDRLQNFTAFRILLILAYAFSILLNLNSQMRTQSLEIIVKRWDAVKIYMKSDFAFQVIPMAAIFIQIFHIQALYYPQRIIFLSTLSIYWKLMKKFENNYSQSVEAERAISLFKLVFRLLVLLHFISLILNAIHIIQMKNGVQDTWVIKNGLEQQNKFMMYVNGYYWASTIVSTVGFGDITPGNVIQRGVCSFIEVFCCLFFGYCLNIIGQTIGFIGQSQARYQKQSRKLNRYLKKLECPNQMKNKLKQHFYNRFQIQQVYDAQVENELFSKMTQQLRTELKQKANIKAVDNSRYLKGFSTQTKKKLANLLSKRVYAPNQVIFDHQTIDIKLRIISQGNVKQFCHINSNFRKAIAEYDKNDNTIGWSNFITGSKYNTCIRADNYVLVYEIDRNLLIDTVKENVKDQMKFNQIREKTLIAKSTYKKDCSLCQKLTHNVVQCPNIHFIPRPLTFLIDWAKKEKILQNLRNSTYRRIQKFATYVYIPQEVYEDFEQKQGSINQVNKFDATNNGLKFLGMLFKKHASQNFKQVKQSKSQNSQYSSQDVFQEESEKGNIFATILPELFNKQTKRQAINSQQTLNASSSNSRSATQSAKKRKTTIISYQQDQFYNKTVPKLISFNTTMKEQKNHKNCMQQFDKVMLQKQQNFFADYHISSIVRLLDQKNKVVSKDTLQNTTRFSFFKKKFQQIKRNNVISTQENQKGKNKRTDPLVNRPNRYQKKMICVVKQDAQSLSSTAKNRMQYFKKA